MSEERNFPPQAQKQQPGKETKMHPRPEAKDTEYQGANKLKGKVALITGGDSGIGRAVAYAFAKEGADVAILYLNEHEDAKETQKTVESMGRKCISIAGDIGDVQFCKQAVKKVLDTFGHINILVNNAAEQHVQENLEDISPEQLERTFRTNIFSFFYMTQAVLPHLQQDDAIVNSASVVAYKGNKHLMDYAATKGAIIAFTRSLSQNLIERGIRVNAVAPGPIWTPLIPASFPKEAVAEFGGQAPMQRAGEPREMAPCYVFLASKDASYMTGQVLHPNGGTVVNG